MLVDPRAQALTDNFAGQWLYTRAVPSVEPDPNVFAIFNEEFGMGDEDRDRALFQYFLSENLPIDHLQASSRSLTSVLHSIMASRVLRVPNSQSRPHR